MKYMADKLFFTIIYLSIGKVFLLPYDEALEGCTFVKMPCVVVSAQAWYPRPEVFQSPAYRAAMA
jgi:hypothetical protein